MQFSMYEASIPPMIRMLQNLSSILNKAAAQTKDGKGDLTALLEARLAPDMYPLTRQIQITSDTAKGCAARLSGQEPPSYPDTETTFPELLARVAKTIDYLQSVKPEQVAGSENRKITLKFPNRTLDFTGCEYLTGFVLPNFYFHLTTAYDILRHKGIQIGKMDYIGGA